MPQSMVSRAITQLERDCGERLFQRTGRGVLLTEFGAQLLPAVARLAADADALADDIRSAREQPVGEVLLGLLLSAVRRFTGPLCAAVRAQMATSDLNPAELAAFASGLANGQVDAAGR